MAVSFSKLILILQATLVEFSSAATRARIVSPLSSKAPSNSIVCRIRRIECQPESEIMRHPGWILIIIGLLVTEIGIVWLTAPSIQMLGNLLGDIRIERENFRFYFPLTTCMLLSLLLTGVAGMVRYFSQ
jgi:hypothetical protein